MITLEDEYITLAHEHKVIMLKKVDFCFAHIMRYMLEFSKE